MFPARRLLACLLLLALAACGTSTPIVLPTLTALAPTPTRPVVPAASPTISPTPVPPIQFDPASLKGVQISVFHAFAGAAADLFNQQLAQFNSTNQWGITVTANSFPDYPSLAQAVQTVSGSTSQPAMVAALPEQALAWEASGLVVDLNAYLTDPTWGLGDGAAKDIPPVFLQDLQVNGKLLGLPAQRSARFLFYNQTWAHQLGFDQAPTSADQFRQQACAANASFKKDSDPKNDGYGGWIVDTSWQTVYAWMLAFGGDVADGNAYGFRTDPNLAALQFIKGLYDDHCAWLSTEPTPFDSFARRSALFISGDLSAISLEKDSMTRLKNSDAWTLIPYPGPQGSRVVAYGPSYTLLKSTPVNQMAAWLFTRWLLSPDNQAQWVENTGLFPLRTSLLGQIGPYRTASPQWQAAVAALASAQGIPQLASWSKVRYVLEDGLATIFLANTPVGKLPSVLDQMDAMAQELNK